MRTLVPIQCAEGYLTPDSDGRPCRITSEQSMVTIKGVYKDNFASLIQHRKTEILPMVTLQEQVAGAVKTSGYVREFDGLCLLSYVCITPSPDGTVEVYGVMGMSPSAYEDMIDRMAAGKIVVARITIRTMLNKASFIAPVLEPIILRKSWRK